MCNTYNIQYAHVCTFYQTAHQQCLYIQLASPLLQFKHRLLSPKLHFSFIVPVRSVTQWYFITLVYDTRHWIITTHVSHDQYFARQQKEKKTDDNREPSLGFLVYSAYRGCLPRVNTLLTGILPWQDFLFFFFGGGGLADLYAWKVRICLATKGLIMAHKVINVLVDIDLYKLIPEAIQC